jgi:hypothetical protein
MKTIYVVAVFLIVVFSFIIYDMYDMSCYFKETECTDEKSTSNTPIVKNTIRCLPDELNSNANLYKDGNYISNKGFVNELMYKPNTGVDDNFVFENKLIDNKMPLNSPKCEFSTDLPIANINVNYMLHRDSTKLQPI